LGKDTPEHAVSPLEGLVGTSKHFHTNWIDPGFIQGHLEKFTETLNFMIKTMKSGKTNYDQPWVILQHEETPVSQETKDAITLPLIPNLASSFLYLVTHIIHCNVALLDNMNSNLDSVKDTEDLIFWLRNLIFWRSTQNFIKDGVELPGFGSLPKPLHEHFANYRGAWLIDSQKLESRLPNPQNPRIWESIPQTCQQVWESTPQ
jgi:hypothetical protein